ncbi:hypothetical protein Pmani_021092 [Petrolisthes manimaculis]|uniref:C-type lectin domain-containing protein n=1 Tax=Petrolisthes manimaculis TaxID=1843537 RepID=A0AAE1PFI0_9EUCA|nr:hypothetical protein Pmani_021092 [Petrolisthes manimaculis]
MISSLKVALLILGLLCPCSADITPRHVSNREVNELEENLAVNQLAILHLLNKDLSESNYERISPMESEIQEELRDLRLRLREVVEEFTTLTEDLITLKNFVYVGKFFHHEGKDFYVNKEQKMSWTDSRQWCQDRGGDLAQPTGDLITFKQQVHQFILPYTVWVGHEGVWMGGSDITSEGQWFWLSGTQLPNNFPWDGIQPDNTGGIEDCLEIFYKRDGTTDFYNDQVCTYRSYFVCEL